jgi:vitamin B12 transporter
VIWLLFWAAIASAQDEYGATGEVDPEIAATNEEDPTASGTSVSARDRVGSLESARDLLDEVPGAQPFSLGPDGSFSSVSLRGAEHYQSTVLFDTLVLGGPDQGGFDLSLVPIAALDRIEVYRGGAPVRFSEGSIGGVVRLVPRESDEDRAGAVFELGSFGALRLDGHASVSSERGKTFFLVGMAGADNDYPFFDDGATPLDPSDDVDRPRRNSEFLEGHGLGLAEVEMGDVALRALVYGLSRRGGEPGNGASEALVASYYDTSFRTAVEAIYRREDAEFPHHLSVQAGVAVERERFAMPTDTPEIGLITGFSRDTTLRLFGRAEGGVELADWLEITSIAGMRHDGITREHDRAGGSFSDRWTPSIAAEANFRFSVDEVHFSIRPSGRFAGAIASIDETSQSSSELLPTARLGLVIAPASFLAFSASAATGRRAPSMLELFGNRATLLENPSLEPEDSIGLDAGAVARGREGIVEGRAEARFFYLVLDDLIRYELTSQFQARAENVGRGRLLGVELGLEGALTEHVRLTSAFTWLDARDDRDARLPLRPQLSFQARPEAHSGPLFDVIDDAIVFVEVNHVGTAYSDSANLIELRARTTLAAGARIEVFEERLSIGFTLYDLFDVRGRDLLGFPLPGRRFALSIALSESL